MKSKNAGKIFKVITTIMFFSVLGGALYAAAAAAQDVFVRKIVSDGALADSEQKAMRERLKAFYEHLQAQIALSLLLTEVVDMRFDVPKVDYIGLKEEFSGDDWPTLDNDFVDVEKFWNYIQPPLETVDDFKKSFLGQLIFYEDLRGRCFFTPKAWLQTLFEDQCIHPPTLECIKNNKFDKALCRLIRAYAAIAKILSSISSRAATMFPEKIAVIQRLFDHADGSLVVDPDFSVHIVGPEKEFRFDDLLPLAETGEQQAFSVVMLLYVANILMLQSLYESFGQLVNHKIEVLQATKKTNKECMYVMDNWRTYLTYWEVQKKPFEPVVDESDDEYELEPVLVVRYCKKDPFVDFPCKGEMGRS